MKSSPSLVAKMHTGARGRFSVKVVNADGTIDESKTYAANQNAKNLILDSGLDLIGITQLNKTNPSGGWAQLLDYAVAGTGTEPTVTSPDGVFSRSGTTVTRDSGTGEFEAGDVGKLIRWDSGEESYIESFSSATEVEVADSGVISGDAITIYAVNQTGLETEVKRSNTYPQYDDSDGYRASDSYFDQDNGTVTLKRTYDFSAEGAGGETYTEIGVSYSASAAANLFSRIVLPVPVFVDDGQQLRVTYYLTLTIGGSIPSLQETVEGGITGWPRPYTIDEIVSTVSDFTVTLTETHHYSAGGVINIDGATPSGYNGEWIIDSVDGADITILDASDLGAGSGGTVYNNTRRKFVAVNSGVYSLQGYGFAPATRARAFYTSSQSSAAPSTSHPSGLFNGYQNFSNGHTLLMRPFLSTTFIPPTKPFSFWYSGNISYPADGSSNESGVSSISEGTPGGNNPAQRVTSISYSAGDFFQDYQVTYPAGALNTGPFVAILLAQGGSTISSWQGYILFEEPQRKDSTHTLTLTFRVSWGRDLSNGSN